MLQLPRDYKLISAWLLVGVVMIFFQILLGGITRLTGSGLSITKWDIVTGTIPPLSRAEWEESFDLYKQTPQYRQINQGMSLSQYQFIFFWEYVHRLWARLMGFIFLFPFLFFLFRGSLSKGLLQRLGVVILLASLAAIFGWIMVASGLVDRPWVNAYKLTIHLGLGISLFVFMFFTWLSYRGYKHYAVTPTLRNGLKILIALVIVQLAFGGFLSGMKAAMNYPTWPLMNGRFIPEILMNADNWNAGNFLLYDKSEFMPALVQFVHRNLAYVIAVFVIIFALRWKRRASSAWHWISWGLIGIIVVQVGLGILTVINSIGSIPVLMGALHQGVGILFFTFLIYINQITEPIKI